MLLYEKILNKIRNKFQNKNIIITNSKNIQWLSGKVDNFGIIVITKDNQYVFTTEGFAPRFNNKIYEIITFEKLNSEKIKEKPLKMILNYLKIKNVVSDIKYKNIKNVSQEILKLRSIKFEEEIKLLKKAREITEKSINYVIKNIYEGIKEIEIAGLLEMKMRKLGAECFSFNTIVASGKNSFLTHTTPTNKKLNKNDIILIDAGAVYSGYSADITRTICFGENKEFERINQTLQEINKNILEKIKVGVKIKYIDNFYKNSLLKLNFKYLHGVCHGIGVDVHEHPSIFSNDKFEEGNVFTIEPGIYIQNKFGVRFEDMYYINKRGECTCLNK
ncbi:MAG: Xaa-Pro peptidase family protein [Candidatus Aenigmatarchaeota archaeon]